MHIDSSSFGNIRIDGRDYSSDVIIYPDRVDGSWWRKEGHRLRREDILEEILPASPEVFIVGTGWDGRMKIDPQLKMILEQKGIELLADITPAACRLHNELTEGGKTVITALHLTC